MATVKKCQLATSTLGEHIIIKAGEIIPCDGLVIEGRKCAVSGRLTGEPLPIDKNKGDRVVSGSQNHDSPLVIEILKTAQSSTWPPSTN